VIHCLGYLGSSAWHWSSSPCWDLCVYGD